MSSIPGAFDDAHAHIRSNSTTCSTQLPFVAFVDSIDKSTCFSFSIFCCARDCLNAVTYRAFLTFLSTFFRKSPSKKVGFPLICQAKSASEPAKLCCDKWQAECSDGRQRP